MTFRRNGVATNNLIHGGSGSLGVKPTTNLAIEVNAEGGNFAAGSVSGFSYFIHRASALLPILDSSSSRSSFSCLQISPEGSLVISKAPLIC
jgi:hypothetical protein